MKMMKRWFGRRIRQDGKKKEDDSNDEMKTARRDPRTLNGTMKRHELSTLHKNLKELKGRNLEEKQASTSLAD